MLSNHKLQMTMEEIKDISRIDLALYSDKGKLNLFQLILVVW